MQNSQAKFDHNEEPAKIKTKLDKVGDVQQADQSYNYESP
jgi:hypothetical protein